MSPIITLKYMAETWLKETVPNEQFMSPEDRNKLIEAYEAGYFQALKNNFTHAKILQIKPQGKSKET